MCTLLTEYNRKLPRALSQWNNTKAVICPSRGEPFSNIPLEVSLWAKDSGPVLICSDIDGYTEQIIHKKNGFLFNLSQRGDLARQIEFVLTLTPEHANRIRKNAYKKVINERDFLVNFSETLKYYWSDR